MPQNFIACDREQLLMMPPSLVHWVCEDHLVWSILGAVDQMDLGAFYGEYRENGQGRAAYEPSMMAQEHVAGRTTESVSRFVRLRGSVAAARLNCRHTNRPSARLGRRDATSWSERGARLDARARRWEARHGRY